MPSVRPQAEVPPAPAPMPAARHHRSIDATAVDLAVRLGLLGLFVYWSSVVMAPFVPIILWAIILAVSLSPLHQRLTSLLRGRSRLAATLLTVAGLAILLGPATALALSLLDTLQGAIHSLREGTLGLPPPPERLLAWPVFGRDLHDAWLAAATNIDAVLKTHRAFLLEAGGTVLGKLAQVAGGVLVMAVALVVAGTLYGYGPTLVRSGHRLARRVMVDRGEDFLDLAGATIRNVARGVIGVSVLQALLAGAGFLAISLPAAGLATVGVLVLSIIQIGPGLIVLPAVLWAWAQGATLTALLFTLYIVPVALLDNVLKPLVMAHGLRTPMLVILAGVIGGTLAYGLTGLFLGPIVLAVFYELLKAWMVIEDFPATSANRGHPDKEAS